MKRIIAAVDLSEPSLRAFDLAADLANKYDAELVLLTVGHDINRILSCDGGLREDGTLNASPRLLSSSI